MEKAYEIAFKESIERLKNKGEAFLKGKNIKIEDGKISVIYFKKEIKIDYKNFEFSEKIKDKEKILIFHYLLSNPYPFSEKLLTFKNLPDGNFYFPSIYSRIYKPIIETFGKNPYDFLKKSIELEGEIIEKFTVRFNVFPDVFCQFELLQEDEEFPPDLKIYFNETTAMAFDIEDIVIICEVILSKISI